MENFLKCSNFEVNCENSDAKCFDDENQDIYTSESIVIDTNSLVCEKCPYNEKYKDLSYSELKEILK